MFVILLVTRVEPYTWNVSNGFAIVHKSKFWVDLIHFCALVLKVSDTEYGCEHTSSSFAYPWGKFEASFLAHILRNNLETYVMPIY